MDKIAKLASGNQIPVVGFGVYLIPPKDTALAVKQALEIGYRHIDSASCYENEAECAQGIIQFLKENPHVKRSDIFYTTKIWVPDFGYELAKKAIKTSFDLVKSLEYIDLYLIHCPEASPEVRLGTYKAMQEAVESGILRDIGVSCYGVHHLKELLSWPELRVRPSVNQIELNPWLQHGDITRFCADHGITVEAFSPLMAGMRLDDPELVRLANKYHKSVAQVLLRWHLQKGFVPLPKSANPKRIKENFELFDFTIDDQDVANLGDKNAYFVTVPEWDPTIAP
jgi:diketogulonate reductase-like aldo/keto reductase